MMQLEKMPGFYKSYQGTIEEREILKARFAKCVPYRDTFGKYCIHSSILYPRHKIKNRFEKYNESIRIGTRHIAKNESYANVIVFPVDRVNQLLKDSRTTTGEGGKEIVRYVYMGKAEAQLLKDAYEIATTYSAASLVDSQEFFKELGATCDRLSIKDCEIVSNLLKGDDSSRTLGMEMLSNYDIEKSVLAICYLMIGVWNLDRVPYFNSTSFRAFRKRFSDVAKVSFEYLPGKSLLRLYQNLDKENLYIDEFEQALMKTLICADLQANAKQYGCILKIDESDVYLHLPSIYKADDKPEVPQEPDIQSIA